MGCRLSDAGGANGADGADGAGGANSADGADWVDWHPGILTAIHEPELGYNDIKILTERLLQVW